MTPHPSAKQRRDIPTLVKDSNLVEEKRRQIVEAAVGLFVRKGFHQATTREIAREAGFSTGLLYEYVSSKEDVLYLVCDSIHREMEMRLREELEEGRTPLETLERAIESYIRACDRMQDSILLIYRETASLNGESRGDVLEHEERITAFFERILDEGVKAGTFRLHAKKSVRLMAHTIVVLGHMWAFRRWYLREAFTLDEYIRHQSSLILGEVAG